MKRPLNIFIPEEPCPEAAIIAELSSADLLPAYVHATSPEQNTDGAGNCHEAALGLMTDLIVAGCAEGWCWASGRTRHYQGGSKTMNHSWVEYGDWAFDVANGRIVVMRRWDFRRVRRARAVVSRTAKETRRYLEARARRGA